MGQLPASCLHHGAVLQPRRGAVSEGTPLRPLPPGQVALSLQPEHVVAFCHIIYLGSQSPLRRSGRINNALGFIQVNTLYISPLVTGQKARLHVEAGLAQQG